MEVVIFKQYRNGKSRQKAKKKFLKNVNNILDKAKRGKTSTEKERIVHDMLVKRLIYNYYKKDLISSQSASSTLINNRTVCTGYAITFSLLMNALNIQTICVFNQDHAWNKIKIGKRWYNVDVTWDDADDGKVYHDYFNISDARIKKLDEDHCHSKYGKYLKRYHIPASK